MGTIRLERVAKTFGDHVAVDGVDMTIDDGEFFVLLGSSGCGKTTLLRMIAGLETPTSGTITVDGVSVNEMATRHRQLGMLFQQSALYPHFTVRENIGFPLKLAGERRRDIDRAVQELARAVGLSDVLELRPRRLSGGMRQRAALARAIIRSPELLLMDEPMSNLDAKLRTQLRGELMSLQRAIGATAVYVTHDQVEAMALADRIAVLHAGRVVQLGTPMEIYLEPVSAFVATFVGSPPTHLFAAELAWSDGEVVARTQAGDVPLGDRRGLTPGDVGRRVAIGVRPEGLHIVGPALATGRATGLAAEIVGSVSIGDHHELSVSLAAPPVTADPLPEVGDADTTTVMVHAPHAHAVDLWRPFALAVDPDRVLVFDLTTGLSLHAELALAAPG